jgi:hypothetical protein
MADTRPCSGLSEVRLRRSGAGPAGAASAEAKGGTTFEMLRVKGVAGDERYRVRLLRRSEEFVPEVREFCKHPQGEVLRVPGAERGTHLGVNRM